MTTHVVTVHPDAVVVTPGKMTWNPDITNRASIIIRAMIVGPIADGD
jgi:hypothetical protein